MMELTVAAVGRLKESYWREAEAEYLKRLSRYCAARTVEAADEPTPDGASAALEERIMLAEWRRLEPHAGGVVIALDRRGKKLTSEGLSELIERETLSGASRFTFLIGGSLGLHADAIKASKYVLSFSDMTFPHQLFRVMLLEQLYRAFKISRGEPYHK